MIFQSNLKAIKYYFSHEFIPRLKISLRPSSEISFRHRLREKIAIGSRVGVFRFHFFSIACKTQFQGPHGNLLLIFNEFFAHFWKSVLHGLLLF